MQIQNSDNHHLLENFISPSERVKAKDSLVSNQEIMIKLDTHFQQLKIAELLDLELEKGLLKLILFWKKVSNTHIYNYWKIDTNPSPDKYNIPSSFELNNTTSSFSNHMKGDVTYCFGAGRDELYK